jgi:hypothetical protein
MTNPVTPFRNDLFGSRGMDIQEALNYAEMLINTLSNVDQVAVRTAIGVLLNTIEKAVTQSQGPSPEKIAIIALIDERIDAHKLIREDAIGDAVDAHIHNLDDKIADWMDNNLRDKVMDIIANEDDIDDQISNWMSNNFDITDYNVDDAIESWADNNLDEKIQDAISNIEFSVTVK